MATYEAILKPSIKDAPKFFTYDGKEDLFQTVMDVYMNSQGPVHPRAAIAPYQQTVNQ